MLLTRLRAAGYGCHVGQKFLGALGYADDVLLLSPTLYGLDQMINVCEQFSKDYDIMFNPSKCKLLAFGNDEDVSVYMNDSKVTQVSSEPHLGFQIGASHKVDSANIDIAVQNIYGRINLLLRQFGKACCDVKYYLFKSYCMSLYGCPLFCFASKHISKLYVCWRKCIRRLFDLPTRTHCQLLHHICQDSPIDVQLANRFIKFFTCAYNSQNEGVALCAKLALYGSRSNVSDSINFICTKFSLDKYHCFDNVAALCIDYASDDAVLQTAATICDFIGYRESNNSPDLTDIINYLCTSL